MALFIRVDVSNEATRDKAIAAKLTEVCPVNIFATESDGTLRICDENLDECTLCDLCIEAAPRGAVRVVKLYEEAG